MQQAIDELVYARDLITGKIEEDAPYKDKIMKTTQGISGGK